MKAIKAIISSVFSFLTAINSICFLAVAGLVRFISQYRSFTPDMIGEIGNARIEDFAMTIECLMSNEKMFLCRREIFDGETNLVDYIKVTDLFGNSVTIVRTGYNGQISVECANRNRGLMPLVTCMELFGSDYIGHGLSRMDAMHDLYGA